MNATYDAIVYDLDGTLVRLAVDWEQAREEVAAKLRVRNISVEDDNLWTLFERAILEGLKRPVHETLEAHERDGARSAQRLPLADELPWDIPVGVCSLNAESACRIALELHGLDGYIDALVGRDTVPNHKPHPEPLLTTVDRLGATPEQTLFIGDSESDAETAERAGTDFQYVSDRLP